jgi:GTP-binding protein
MIIRSAQFVKSSPSIKDCPDPTLPEFAFIGRSNVGKSSLINMITGFSKLAKTSSRPGKTQLINHFLINESWYLTDLPGFGFAKVPLSIKNKWEEMIKGYLRRRDSLICSFLLIDIRHEPLKNDLEFMTWLGESQIPFIILFTKADKLPVTKRLVAVEKYKKKLSELWDPIPEHFLTSSESRAGKEEVLALIEKFSKDFSI